MNTEIGTAAFAGRSVPQISGKWPPVQQAVIYFPLLLNNKEANANATMQNAKNSPHVIAIGHHLPSSENERENRQATVPIRQY